MSHENNLRESLFNAEPISPERQQRFREELARIVEPRLPRSYRLYYIMALVGLVAGLPGAVCAALFDLEHRWMWALFLLVCIAFAGWIVYILRRGAEPLRIMQGMSKAFAGIGALVAGLLIFYGLQSPSLASVLWALLGLLVFLLTSFINLWNRVITAERTMREHILRVEYRLADLGHRPR
jgi:4-amino-4-deoxy-L-arabinose transferase-like glycosyltransferase